MQPAKDGRVVSKINTTLLSICTAGVLWMAKETNSLDSRMSSLEALFSARYTNQQTYEKKVDDHSGSIADIVLRLSRLEYIIEDKNKKQIQ